MRPLRGAIVGFGFIAERGHLPAYLALAREERPFEIVAVADHCPARLEAARAALPNARLYSSHRALLDRERGRIDFVDVTTPPCDHAAIAHAALDRGLHVLCEKPLATRREDARAMLDHARSARRVIFPCHNYKHAPVIRTVNRILASRVIGDVRLVTLDTFRTTHARGVNEWRPDWRRERAIAGGGIAMDHGPHTFYLAMSWLNSAPTAITAKMSSLGAADTEDTFSCTLSFPTGVATATLTWNAGARKVIYTVHGERGAVRIEDDAIEITVREGPQRRLVQQVASDWMDAGHAEWFQSMLEQFVVAIDAKEYVGPDARDALACVELIASAYVSARSGCREIPLAKPVIDAPVAAPIAAVKERAS